MFNHTCSWAEGFFVQPITAEAPGPSGRSREVGLFLQPIPDTSVYLNFACWSAPKHCVMEKHWLSPMCLSSHMIYLIQTSCLHEGVSTVPTPVFAFLLSFSTKCHHGLNQLKAHYTNAVCEYAENTTSCVRLLQMLLPLYWSCVLRAIKEKTKQKTLQLLLLQHEAHFKYVIVKTLFFHWFFVIS